MRQDKDDRFMPAITLRALEPEDLDTLYCVENDRSLWNVGNTNVPYSKFLLRDYIATSTGDIYADRQVRLIVELDNSVTVGIIDLMNFDPCNLRAEIGIVILPDYRGRGYARAAISQMAEYASEVIHIHQLYAFIDVDNSVSVSLFEKEGFVPVSDLRDWLFDGKQYHKAKLFQRFL